MIPDLSTVEISKIVSLNAFLTGETTALFGLKSLINHSPDTNISITNLFGGSICLMYASRDINEGEEITLDYVSGVDDAVDRNLALEKYGIIE